VRGCAVACIAIALGCAPAAPLLSGGRTVPRDRTELMLGAAIRVPVGDLVPELPDDNALAYAAPGGVAPLGSVRHGIDPNVDLGIDVVGSTLRGLVRGQLSLGSVSLILGVMPEIGVMSADTTSIRAGALGSAVIGIDITSLYEAWIGVRVGLEHLAGEGVGMSGLRTGGVVGIAAGFRRFHVLVELAVDHEYWWGTRDDISIERNGLSLTPAFALRLRL
jgi:hypothetical protein